jgi:hypothetical protein
MVPFHSIAFTVPIIAVDRGFQLKPSVEYVRPAPPATHIEPFQQIVLYVPPLVGCHVIPSVE